MKILLLMLLAFTLALSEEYQEDDSSYILGEGIQVASLPLYVGGYLSTDYLTIPEQDYKRFQFDDIAFLLYGSYSKFSYMMELEFKEFYVNQWSNQQKQSEVNTKLHIERLYVDYKYDENIALRLGKFNSPIGYWNMVPINVLRDTTSSPISSSILFPKYTTGLDASYSYYSDFEIKVDTLVQNNQDFDDEYNNLKVDKHYGIGIEYTVDDLSVKFNGGYFHTLDTMRRNQDIYYTLFAIKYEKDDYKIMGEIGEEFDKDGSVIPFTGYIQGTYSITEQHIPVLRFEAYENETFRGKKRDEFGIIGYTYRPLFPIACKAEYQFHKESDENKALFSLSVMF